MRSPAVDALKDIIRACPDEATRKALREWHKEHVRELHVRSVVADFHLMREPEGAVEVVVAEAKHQLTKELVDSGAVLETTRSNWDNTVTIELSVFVLGGPA